ncbi:MAG: hypothetical protein MnENMB40S_38340 [Rhizobiaceae bacterium MnEN-MB40S]|nr:MAG: hypothetical protein MnENMB40S_38340 [Rhizobiaceae bacterium MnEN-MB40S]
MAPTARLRSDDCLFAPAQVEGGEITFTGTLPSYPTGGQVIHPAIAGIGAQRQSVGEGYFAPLRVSNRALITTGGRI